MSLCPAFSDPSWLHVSECNKGKMMGYWGRDKRGGDILIGGGGRGLEVAKEDKRVVLGRKGEDKSTREEIVKVGPCRSGGPPGRDPVRAEVRRSFITTTVREESQVTPQVGFELETNGFQFYAIANLDKTYQLYHRLLGPSF